MFSLLLLIPFFALLLKKRTSFSPQGETSYDVKKSNHKKFLKRLEAKKRELRRELGLPRKAKYEPQGLVDFAIYTRLHDHLRKHANDVVIDKVEGLVALYFVLSECASAKQFVAAITLYAKTHCSKSLSASISEQASKLFDDMTPQSNDRPQWLDLMQKSLTDWKLVVANPAFKKVSRVLSMMVTLGIFQNSPSFNFGGLELFSVSALEKQVSAVDLVDAVVETVVFFAEGAYQCFQEGSFRPMLFSSSKIVEIEKRYIEMLSLWEYARNGNLMRFMNMEEAQFDHDLKQLVQDLEDMYKTTPIGSEKKILCDRWREMSKILTEFESSRVRGGLRCAPFVFKVFGESSVGKSSFTDTLMASLLKANGYPCTDDYIITLNPDDKHMSNMRSYVTGIKIDDYGNTKLDFVDLAPSDWLITIANNIKRYAVMADLANKGKVSIEPAVVSITTNVEDLLAHQVSNEPVSIGRRAHVHIDLKVKPEFCKYDELGNLTHMLDPIKVFEKYGDSDEIQDIWNVTIRELQIQPSGCQGKRLAPTFEFINKQDYTDVSIFKVLDFMLKESKKHFMVQKTLVGQQTNLSERLPWCERCNKPSQLCDHLDPQFGFRLASTLKGYTSKWETQLHRRYQDYSSRAEDYAVEKMLSALSWFEDSSYAKWTNYVPDSWIDNDLVKSFVLVTNKTAIETEVKSYVIRTFGHAIFASLLIWMFLSFMLSVVVLSGSALMIALSYASIIEHTKSAFYDRIKKERDVMPTLFKKIRAKHANYICGALASVALLWGLVKTIKAFRSMTSFQGNLSPRSVEEIQNRDSEVNPWSSVQPVDPGVGKRVGNMKEWENLAKKSLWNFEYPVEGGRRHCNAFAVRTNVFMIPKHMIPSSVTRCTMRCNGQVVSFLLDPEKTASLSATDLALVYVPNSGSLKDMVEYFATDYERRGVPSTFFYRRDTDGVVVVDDTFWKYDSAVYNGVAHFAGSYYTLSKPTFGGLCMGMHVSNTVHKSILGFHLGGITGKCDGCASGVVRSQLQIALATLYSLSKSHIRAPQATELPDEILGKKFETGKNLHKKAPVMWCDKDAAVLAYGSVTGRAPYKSSVVETPISKIVEEETGVANKWGPPKFKLPKERTTKDGVTIVDNQTWRPWSESLLNCQKPSIGFPTSDVDRALDDYLVGMKRKFDEQADWWKTEIRPLTDTETVSGIDGKRFIDAMPAGTSMGFPIGGPKRPHLIEVESEEHMNPRQFTPEIMAEIHAALEDWSNGKCVNPIFGSALKDEPTKLTKDKVRVFQAAPIVLQFGIRKYFLPVARFLSVYPLESECAVGINSHGPEWNALAQHMRKFGADRIIAGDYSKYDLRMPAQLTQTAFAGLIQIAKWTGNYTAKDIIAMESIAYEVSCPLVAFNGDLLRFLGTNPSGQNMTVYINSIVNSLLHRLGFYDAYSQEELVQIGDELDLGRPAEFRDLVAISIYGDDVKGSVKRGYDKFNHVSFANFLARNDMKFTMPDKESDPVPFMEDHQADFLKRKNREDETLGMTVGMLEEDSIFKSLHSVLKSKAVTLEEVSAQNVDGALREWFYYGEDHFEMRRAQMKKVVERAKLICPAVDVDYQTRAAEWKTKYTAQAGFTSTPKGTHFAYGASVEDVDHYYGKLIPAGRTDSAMYLGRGVFLGSPTQATHVRFEGRKYECVRYKPSQQSTTRLVMLYFCFGLVKKSSHLVLPDYKEITADNAVFRLGNRQPFTTYEEKVDGGDWVRPNKSKRSVSMMEAEEVGLQKFAVPDFEPFNCHKRKTDFLWVESNGERYPCLLGYHLNQDWSRSKKCGTIRIFTRRTMDIRWIKA